MSHFALKFGLNTNWITKTAGLSSGLSISIFYQISLTSSNGMANSQKSPIFKPPGILEAVLLSARTVLPIKSSSALSLSITKESKSIAPKRSHKPSTPKFDPADEPPPYRRGEKASGDETPFSSPSSSTFFLPSRLLSWSSPLLLPFLLVKSSLSVAHYVSGIFLCGIDTAVTKSEKFLPDGADLNL